MSYAKFIEKVRRMRFAQTKYFKTRTQADLRKAKDAEKEVDDVIQEFNDLRTSIKQLKLL